MPQSMDMVLNGFADTLTCLSMNKNIDARCMFRTSYNNTPYNSTGRQMLRNLVVTAFHQVLLN